MGELSPDLQHGGYHQLGCPPKQVLGGGPLSRIVAVSNRVAAPKQGKQAGGLAVGVLAALEEYGGIWFGWGGKVTAGDTQGPKISQLGRVTYATIDLNRQDYDRYYNGFSNDTLWPLFHYFLGFVHFDRRQYEAYLRVNELFARRLAPLLRDDDLIWVHDYHLIPLARELRRAGISQPIGFFLHVPFPDFDVLRALPVYTDVLHAMCAYDVIGFQTQRDLRSFQEAVVQQEIGAHIVSGGKIKARGHLFMADVFPIGIDTAAVQRMAMEAVTSPAVRRMAKSLTERELVIGVDRLDYSKGLPERFQAFEQLLENYPENRGRVVYMQIAPPTRTGVRTYGEIRGKLERAAGHINGRFADTDWVPIRYLNKAFDRTTLAGFFRTARVGLVTPVRDGMNLIAKEYVASQDPEAPGALVLSTLAGAAKELDAATLVNPYDTAGMAEGMQSALSMPLEERRERYRAMIDALQRNDITAWRTRFVEALLASAGVQVRAQAR